MEASGFDLSLTGFDEGDISDLLGLSVEEPKKGSLSDRFGVPPFSILNAREGWWQDRKRAWIDLGIRSELGRGAAPGGAPMPIDRNKATPGGVARPATNYSKTKARGDGTGRAIP